MDLISSSIRPLFIEIQPASEPAMTGKQNMHNKNMKIDGSENIFCLNTEKHSTHEYTFMYLNDSKNSYKMKRQHINFVLNNKLQKPGYHRSTT